MNILTPDNLSSMSDEWSNTDDWSYTDDFSGSNEEEFCPGESFKMEFMGSSNNNNVISKTDSLLPKNQAFDEIINEFADLIADQMGATELEENYDKGDLIEEEAVNYEVIQQGKKIDFDMNDNNFGNIISDNLVSGDKTDDLHEENIQLEARDDYADAPKEDEVDDEAPNKYDEEFDDSIDLEVNINNNEDNILAKPNEDYCQVTESPAIMAQLKANEELISDDENESKTNNNNQVSLRHGDSQGDSVNDLKSLDTVSKNMKDIATENLSAPTIKIPKEDKEPEGDLLSQSIIENEIDHTETVSKIVPVEDKENDAEIKNDQEKEITVKNATSDNNDPIMMTEDLCRDFDVEIELESESEISSINLARESDVASVIMKNMSERINDTVQSGTEEEEEIVSTIFDTEPLHPIQIQADDVAKSISTLDCSEPIMNPLDASGERKEEILPYDEPKEETALLPNAEADGESPREDDTTKPIEIKPQEPKEEVTTLQEEKKQDVTGTKEFGTYFYESNDPLISDNALTIANASDTLKLLKVLSYESKSEDFQQQLINSADIPKLTLKKYKSRAQSKKISRKKLPQEEEKKKMELLLKSMDETQGLKSKENQSKRANQPAANKSGLNSRNSEISGGDVYTNFLSTCTCKRVFYFEPNHPIIQSHRNKSDRRLKSVCTKNECIIEIEGPLVKQNGVFEAMRILKRHDQYYACIVACQTHDSLEKSINYMKATFNAPLHFV